MKPFYVILSLLLFVSCETEVDYDYSDFEREPVVNSILSTDSGFNVDLHWTKSVFDDADFQHIENARVTMHNVSSNIYSHLSYNGDGQYVADNKPAEGQEYVLYVDIGKERLWATTQIPHNLDANVKVETDYKDGSFSSFSIDLEILDNPNEENFYIYEVVKRVVGCHEADEDKVGDNLGQSDNGSDDTENGTVDDSGQTRDSSVIAAPGIEDYETIESYTNQTDFESKNLNATSFVSDRDSEFDDNNKFTTSIVLTKEEIENDNDNRKIEDIILEDDSCEEEHIEYALKIMTVSAELFDYLKSVDLSNQQQRVNTSNTIPVNIESNIENGLGIFGGVNVQIFPIQ